MEPNRVSKTLKKRPSMRGLRLGRMGLTASQARWLSRVIDVWGDRLNHEEVEYLKRLRGQIVGGVPLIGKQKERVRQIVAKAKQKATVD